jgi:hypothetical protein
MGELRWENNRWVCDDTPEEKAAFAANVRTLMIAPSALPTRSGAGEDKKAWAKMEKDMPAYKRLRDEGLQPPSVRGSADLEARAVSKADIESAAVA